MILYPAIDLKEGRCVRLRQGDMAQATIFNNDPAAQAASFAASGFGWVHVVDLDGAFAGKPANAAAVQAILAAVPGLPVQLGGGIRDMATAEAWLAAGVARIILGSAAVKDPDFARAACRAFPGRVALGLDARDGYVATEGWAETSDVTARDLALRFAEVDPATAPFLMAALQVVWTDLASRVTPTDVPYLDQPGLCPVCGSHPVASVVRARGARGDLTRPSGCRSRRRSRRGR